MLNDSREREQGVGADIVIQPPGASFLMGLSGLPASQRITDKLRPLQHVKAVTAVGVWTITSGGLQTIDGIDLDSFEAVAGPFRYRSGGPFQRPDDILVDDVFADGHHVGAGDQIELLNQQFKIVGVVQHGKLARIYMPLRTMQELLGTGEKASIFFLKLDNSTNEVVPQVMSSIKAIPGMQTYRVYSMQEWISLLTTDNLPGLSKVIYLVISVAMVIGFIVIFQAMYTAIMERTREIGILKSLGASKLYIVDLVFRETILLATAGCMIGIAASLLIKSIIKSRLPMLTVMIQMNWVVYAVTIAVFGAILGATYPAFKGAQKDPIDALAYE
jgi:putative ABC transport system permease protein